MMTGTSQTVANAARNDPTRSRVRAGRAPPASQESTAVMADSGSIRLPSRLAGWCGPRAWQRLARAGTRMRAGPSSTGGGHRWQVGRRPAATSPPRWPSRARANRTRGPTTESPPGVRERRVQLGPGGRVEDLAADSRGRLGRRAGQVPGRRGRAGHGFVECPGVGRNRVGAGSMAAAGAQGRPGRGMVQIAADRSSASGISRPTVTAATTAAATVASGRPARQNRWVREVPARGAASGGAWAWAAARIRSARPAGAAGGGPQARRARRRVSYRAATSRQAGQPAA